LPRTSDDADIAVRVRDVRKSFVLRHTHSLKETFVAFTRRKMLSSSFDALRGVTFDIRRGESVALLGFNGSGKSTLLKLLSGVLRPDSGEIGIRGRLAGLIEVGGGFHPDLTGRENVFLNAAILGMSEAETRARYDQIVEFSEIADFMETEVKYYSSGMFVRLAFAVAIHVECDILLIDEVLAVGDEPFQRKCFAKIDEMKAAGTTIVLVTHDLSAAERLCDRGIVLNQHQVAYDGPSTGAVEMLRAV
jgi:ABC-2 type transport system ATP-binding protein